MKQTIIITLIILGAIIVIAKLLPKTWVASRLKAKDLAVKGKGLLVVSRFVASNKIKDFDEMLANKIK